jgi:hypothetical protein
MPLPVANGEILEENVVISSQDEENLLRSEGNLSKELPGVVSASDTVCGELIRVGSAQSAASSAGVAVEEAANELVLYDNRRALEKAFEKERRKIDVLSRRFNELVKYKGRAVAYKLGRSSKGEDDVGEAVITGAFKLGSASVLASLFLLSGPAAAAAGILGGLTIVFPGAIIAISHFHKDDPWKAKNTFTENGVTLPAYNFARIVKRLREEFNNSSDPAYKQAGLQTLDQISISAQTLKARHAFKNAAEKGGPYRRFRAKSEIKALHNLATEKGMSEPDIKALILALRKDPSAGYFENKIEFQVKEQTKELAALLGKRQEKALKALPAP